MINVYLASAILLGPYLLTQVAGISTCPLKTHIESITDFQVTLKITNTHNSKSVCALKWNSVMDDEYWAASIDLWQSEVGTAEKNSHEKTKAGDDIIMDYTKVILPLRKQIQDSDYQFFGPKSSSTIELDLKEVFNFAKGRHYSITILNTLLDCYTTSSTCQARTAKKWEEHKGEKTDSEENLLADKISHSKPEVLSLEYLRNRGIIVDTTNDTINAAHNNAIKQISDTISYLKGGSEDKPLCDKWFGKGNRNKVLCVFTEIEDELSKLYAYWTLPSDLCREDELANTPLPGKNQHFINICPLFFEKEEKERTTTIVHEMTHDSSDTMDTTYSVEDCKRLACVDSQEACFNAENYAQLANDVQESFIPVLHSDTTMGVAKAGAVLLTQHK